MDLYAWQKHQLDPVRAQRLAGGYLLGAALITTLLTTVALSAAKVYHLDEDQVVDAVLVTGPPEPEIVVKVQEPPKPKVEKPKKVIAPIQEPTRVSSKLIEKEPVVRSDNPYDTEDPYALMEQGAAVSATAEAPKVQEEVKVLVKPKAVVRRAGHEPIRITEDVTPPRAVSMQPPEYPEAAKAAGIEGTVVVRYVVSEAGEVKDVEAVRGPAELVAVCIAAVRSWRFMPAIKDGQAVAVQRLATFPFRIRT